MIRAFVFAAALALAGCQVVSEPPYPPIPPVRVEVMGKPPVTETLLIWQPGHWDWTGAGYQWVPGGYVPREGHGNLWMQGYWEKSDIGWRWQPAHWVR
jgi:hypothetical protein